MDRQIVTPGQIPLDTDLLNTNKSMMLSIGALANAMFGGNTVVNGLSVSPQTVPNLSVAVAPGSIYQVAPVDNSPYGSLPADTTDSTVKQGLQIASVTLACPAPTTAGFSINYLIEAVMTEVDTNPQLLPFYNATNPAQPYSGPGNSGAQTMTTRACQVGLIAKPGIAATTGTQVTPSVDPGYIALAVVTVANGQTTIVAGNITDQRIGITAPQFDASARFATTAFVAAALGSYAGIDSSFTSISATAVIPVTDMGKVLPIGGSSAQAVNLPNLTGIRTGAAITLYNQNSSSVGATYTVTAAAGQNIVVSSAFANTMPLAPGDYVTLLNNGSGSWTMVAGMSNIALSRMSSFQGVQSTNGYQKLPSGLIIQWGQGGSSGTSYPNATITFPLAFPNACLNASATIVGATAGSWSAQTTAGPSKTQATFTMSSGGAAATGVAFNWIAIGS